MNRLFAVAALVALTVTSCAATWYTVPSVTGTSPLADNNQPVCSLTPDLWPVAAGTPRMMRATWTQGGVTVKADSVACGAGSPFTFPGIFVPSSGLVTVSVCAVDVGGIGCPASKTLTPTATTRTPAAPTLAP